MVSSAGNNLRGLKFISKLISAKKIVCLLMLIVLVPLIGIIYVSISNTINPKGIIVHHSAVPFNVTSPEEVALIDEVHRQRGFSIFYWGKNYHIGYHYLILPDGRVVHGRPEKCKGAHAVGFNDYIGICLIGDFSSRNAGNGLTAEEPTDKQLESLKGLIKTLTERYHITSEALLKHKEVNSNTECPGDSVKLQNVLTEAQTSASN